MFEQSMLYFRDTAGKFEAVKDKAYQACCHKYDLTICSLTARGETEPTHLFVKLAPIGKPDGYMTTRLDQEAADVSMLLVDYRTFPAEMLKKCCTYIQSYPWFKYAHKGYVRLCKCVDRTTEDVFSVPSDDIRLMGREKLVLQAISPMEFFQLDPREDEPGTEIYLRDKAFFRSILPDPTRPAFSALTLLKGRQKEQVTAIDMTHADVSGRKVLSGLFEGYTHVRELDVSALDTTGAMDMRRMFYGCRSLRELDLSAFDFSRADDLEGMFGGCDCLETVVFSDTVLRAGRIPHKDESIRKPSAEELNDLYRDVYRSEGPQPAQMAVSRVEGSAQRQMTKVRFGEAAEEEIRRYLGLGSKVKMTVVHHGTPGR